MKNSYKILSNPTGKADIQDMQPGEIAVQVKKFIERNAAGNDIIELDCEIVWSQNAENESFVGKTFTHAIFFGENSAITVKQLKDMFRKKNADVPNWRAEGSLPLEQALPGAIKLLAVREAYVAGKLDRRKSRNGEQMFFGLVKIIDADPATGEAYPEENCIPNPLPNDLIVESLNTVLEGESAKSVL